MDIWTRELGGAKYAPPPHGGQLTLSLAQGTAGPPDLTAQDGGGPNQAQLPTCTPPQQGAAQIAVQPAAGLGRPGAGTTQPPTGTGPIGTPLQEFSGIASDLERLAPLMTDDDTARNLRWQHEVDGDKNNIAAWKLEAMESAGLQFYAYMQPGEAFLVLGHSLSCIYLTTTDVASYRGKIVLFIGDRTYTRECVPVILPSPSALSWVKCPVAEDKTKLAECYADNRSKYGKLWDPLPGDGARVENYVPKLIALPLQAVKLYQDFKGGVMPHELLATIKQHLASDETSLDNGDDWGLVQKWLLVASQRDDGGGDPAKRKPFLALRTDPRPS